MHKKSARLAWQIVLVAIIITVVAMVYALSHAFTWEGELDPNEFDKWELTTVMPNPGGISWVIVKNPDPTHPIEMAALLIDVSSNLLGYRYFKGGEPFGYFFDMDQEKYVRFEYTGQQKQGCMQCHQGHVQPEDARIKL